MLQAVPRAARALVVCLALLPLTASAASKEQAALEKAQAASAAYNIGRFEAAAQLWEEAYLLVQDPNFLFNIGQSYRLAGRPESALPAYRAYLRTAPPEAPHREQVQRRIGELERQRAERQVQVPAPPPAPPPVAGPPGVETAAPPPGPTGGRWRLWAGLGAVVAAGVVTALVVTHDPTRIPRTKLGSERTFDR